MQTTGYGLSALLIAAGAILAYAVTAETSGIDLQQVGVILLIVGAGLAVLTAISSMAGRRTTITSDREAVVGGRQVVEHDRQTVVDREAI